MHCGKKWKITISDQLFFVIFNKIIETEPQCFDQIRLEWVHGILRFLLYGICVNIFNMQIEWTVIRRITTQKIFSDVVALYYIFIVNSLFVSFVFPIQVMW